MLKFKSRFRANFQSIRNTEHRSGKKKKMTLGENKEPNPERKKVFCRITE